MIFTDENNPNSEQIWDLELSDVREESATTELEDGQKSFIQLMLYSENGNPLACQDYTLIVDDIEYVGKTDKNGLLQMEVPEGSERAEVRVPLDDDDSPDKHLLYPLDLDAVTSTRFATNRRKQPRRSRFI